MAQTEFHLPDGTVLLLDPSDPNQVAAARKRAMALSAPQQPAQAAPAAPPAAPPKSVGGFLENSLSSAGNYVGGIADFVKGLAKPNADNTALAIPRLVGGALANVIPESAQPFWMHGNQFADSSKQMAGAVGNQYKERYGGLQNIANTAYTDPVGMSSDLAGLLGGGATLAGKGAALAGKTGLASKAATVGEKLSLLDPMSAVMSGVFKPTAGSVAEQTMQFGEKHKLPLAVTDYTDRWTAKPAQWMQALTDRTSIIGRASSRHTGKKISERMPGVKQAVGADTLDFVNNAVPEAFRRGEAEMWDQARFTPRTEVTLNPNLPEDKVAGLLPAGRGPNTDPRFFVGDRGTGDLMSQYKTVIQSGGHINPFDDFPKQGTPVPSEIGEVVNFPPDLAARYPELFGPDRPVQGLPSEQEVIDAMKRQLISEGKDKASYRYGQPISQKDRNAMLAGQEPAVTAGPGRYQQTSQPHNSPPLNKPPVYTPGEDPRALAGSPPVPGRETGRGHNPYPQTLPPTTISVKTVGDQLSNPFKSVGESFLKQYPNLTGADSPILSFAQKLTEMPDFLTPEEIKFRRTELLDQLRRDPNLLGNTSRGLKETITQAATDALRGGADDLGMLPEFDAARAYTREGRGIIDAKHIKQGRKMDPEQLVNRLLNKERPTVVDQFNRLFDESLKPNSKLPLNGAESAKLGNVRSGLKGTEEVQKIIDLLDNRNHTPPWLNTAQLLGSGAFSSMNPMLGFGGFTGNEVLGAIFSGGMRTKPFNNLVTKDRRLSALMASQLARNSIAGQ